MLKLRCYVDETGQDAAYTIVLVAIIVTATERKDVITTLEAIEKATGKGKVNWAKTLAKYRTAYVSNIFKTESLKGKIYFVAYPYTPDYALLTAHLLAKSLSLRVGSEAYKADVTVGGLSAAERDVFATELQKLSVQTERIRSAKTPNDAILRLADAMCGFLRDVYSNSKPYRKLCGQARKNGYLQFPYQNIRDSTG